MSFYKMKSEQIEAKRHFVLKKTLFLVSILPMTRFE